ncbi:hypothetical protein CB0940_11052 [Cercospora beticola]|uniref:F-box domain-containing protein n=1 Tax=Cercospora beticola TaxID=122368 RepID=A0A2G5HEE2_CERBT|nr:hypothetical protein CB0940_11052 [Cercospora beticola]PIA90924.1 hypothetical protein CB0940_11052 [Cercospora beticola]WPB07881.1 hypothetical protein RHO25_012545 [Cercospora beticola]
MSLEALPPELVDQIVVELPLHDIASLRLTSRTLASTATPEHYERNFHTHHLELTDWHLKRFVAFVSGGGLAHLLRHLTVIAPVYNPLELENDVKYKATKAPVFYADGEFDKIDSISLGYKDLMQTGLDLDILRLQRHQHTEFVNRGGHIALLSRAFGMLKTLDCKLYTITAEVAVYRAPEGKPLMPLYGGGWKHIWTAADVALASIFASLDTSGLQARHLNLFNNSRMLRCSIACDKFSNLAHNSGYLDTFLGNLESLSMSISDKIILSSNTDPMDLHDFSFDAEWDPHATWRTVGAKLCEASDEQNFGGLSEMLRKCRRLKCLEVSHFKLDHRSPVISQAQSKGILSALQRSNLQTVEKLTLEGFDTSEDHLLEILRSLPQLRDITLRCMRMYKGGHWNTVLNHCTATMEEVYLDSLFGPKTLHFKAPYAIRDACDEQRGYYAGLKARFRSDSTDPTDCRAAGRNDEIAASKQIEYSHYKGSELPESPKRSWLRDLENRFGPPGYGGEACLSGRLAPEQIWRHSP